MSFAFGDYPFYHQTKTSIGFCVGGDEPQISYSTVRNFNN